VQHAIKPDPGIASEPSNDPQALDEELGHEFWFARAADDPGGEQKRQVQSY
jgi:hypothetical protein